MICGLLGSDGIHGHGMEHGSAETVQSNRIVFGKCSICRSFCREAYRIKRGICSETASSSYTIQ
jgi:hypothetical protein